MGIKDILDKYGAFYDFDNAKDAKEGVAYYNDGHGLYYPKKAKKALFKELDEYFKGLRDDAINAQIKEQSMKDKQMLF